jgi:hypothetical protein
LPALASPTIEGDYFDWVNADASVIDTEHHTYPYPNMPFPRFGLGISRDTHHLRGSLIHPNRTKLQELGQQHIQEAETRKSLASKSDLPQPCAAGDLNKCPNPIGTNWSTIDLQQLTSNNSEDFSATSQKKVCHSSSSNKMVLTMYS